MAMHHFEVDKVSCTDTELVCFNQRIGLILSKLQSQLYLVERYLCTTDTSNEETRRMFSEAINHCMKLVERFGEFDFHPVKPRNNKKRSHTQLDSRKQVIAFQDRVITINIKKAQHPLK